MKSIASCPAILVSAPASGQGKTTVAMALARLHARRGRRVRVFKCGPDFLDPHWHALASGHPVHQLDLWMTGEEDCAKRLHQAACDADLIVIEGMMGLFDGEPSSADLARRFDLPVLAVVDASAMAGTFGALAYGLQHYQSGLRWAGVLANRAASDRHAYMLASGLAEPDTWLGALVNDPALHVPERHLGLTAAIELADAVERLDAAADALSATPLGQMNDDALRRWEVKFPTGAPTPWIANSDEQPDRPLDGITVAIACDSAFCFIYDANLDTLQALGATLVFFSPLADRVLPRCDAVWLSGGYPELHAPAISANHSLRTDLATHVAEGKPVWAECGGMMTLFEELIMVDGSVCRMWGLLPGTVTMQQRLAALGPQQLVLKDHILRGHTFHYSTCSTPLVPALCAQRPGALEAATGGEAFYRCGSIRASYFHAWFASSPQACARLFLPEGMA
jgi:cobyrinic acid a,c-diamide synthase